MNIWHRGIKDFQRHEGDPSLCEACGKPQSFTDDPRS